MAEEKLQERYNQYIELAAKHILAGVPINQDLLDIITELQTAIRDNDILEATNRIRENGENIDLLSLDQKYFNPLSKDYIDLIPKKELYLNLLKSATNAAVFSEPKTAESSSYKRV